MPVGTSGPALSLRSTEEWRPGFGSGCEGCSECGLWRLDWHPNSGACPYMSKSLGVLGKRWDICDAAAVQHRGD